MNARVRVLSGFGGKGPAAILVEYRGIRLLLDAGGALDGSVDVDWSTGLEVDAAIITHDHVDHIDGVRHLPTSVPVYCTAAVAEALPEGRVWRELPVRGRVSIAGIEITTGLAGHSLGGVWLHLAIGPGIFYSGDFSFESWPFPFDDPPTAGIALLDASYGLYDRPQVECRRELASWLDRRLLLPVPPSGRALEIALWLQRLSESRPLDWSLDDACHRQLARMLALSPACLRDDARWRLSRLLDVATAPQAGILLVADDADTSRWLAGQDRTLLYSGYLRPERRAEVVEGRAHWLRWNVHPRASDLVCLAYRLGATRVVPLFTSLDPLPDWRRLLGRRLHPYPVLDVPNAATSSSLRVHAPWRDATQS